MTDKKELLLCETGDGDIVKLIKITAGAGLKARLAAMGILSGAELKVVNNGHPGPLLVKLRDCKMVLGRGMARKIFVEQVGKNFER